MRKFTFEELKDSDQLELLRRYGNLSGQLLRMFILDCFGEEVAEEVETVGEFISVCTEAFNDMEDDRKAELEKEKKNE